MIRRVIAFAIVWAYTANALWVPGGLDSGYWLSVVFPAPYYLLIGGVVGMLYELLVKRYPHRLVIVALALSLIEGAYWLFAGQTPFIYLALPFVLATLLGSCVVRHPELRRQNPRMTTGTHFGIWLTGLFLLGASSVSSYPNFLRSQAIASPNGGYIARCFEGDDFIDNDDYHVYIGPSRMPLRWFGYTLSEQMYTSSLGLHWVDSNTLAGYSTKDIQAQYCNVQIDLQSSP